MTITDFSGAEVAGEVAVTLLIKPSDNSTSNLPYLQYDVSIASQVMRLNLTFVTIDKIHRYVCDHGWLALLAQYPALLGFQYR